MFRRPCQCREQIGVFGLQFIQAMLLLRAKQARLDLLGEPQEVLNMPALHRGRSAALGQSLLRILPDRLQHPIAHLAVVFVNQRQRLFHQTRQQIQDLIGLESVARTNVLRRFQTKPAREHSEPLKQ